MSEIMQASCVAVGGRGILIQGPPGSGKSSLALALLDRGAELIGDDGVTLAARSGAVWASPPPHIAGLIEVRNVGLLTRPVAGSAPVALTLVLDYAAPRLPEAPDLVDIGGISIPRLALWPDSPVLPLRAEAALERWGLPFPAKQVHIGSDHERI